MNINKLYDNLYVIDDFSNCIAELNGVSTTGDIGVVNQGDCTKRYTYFLEPDDESSSFRFYLESLKSCVEKLFGEELNPKSHIPYMIYEKGCMLDYHDDTYHNADDKENREKLHLYSSVHFINDEYEGGDLHFRDLDIKVGKRKNRLIIFDSEYVHGSLVIESGIKISSTHFWSRYKGD